MGRGPPGTREALVIKPSDDAAQLNLAVAYAESGAQAKALPLFASADAAARARGARMPAQVIVLYAKSFAAAGHTESAIARMKEAAAEAGASPQIDDDLGSLYAQRKDWSHAEEQFEGALRMHPNLAEAHLHLGFVPGGKEWRSRLGMDPGGRARPRQCADCGAGRQGAGGRRPG